MTELFISIDAIAPSLSYNECKQIFDEIYSANEDIAEWFNDSKFKNADLNNKQVIVDILKSIGVQFYFNMSSKKIIESAFYI